MFIQLTFFAPLAHKLGFVNLFRVGTVIGTLLLVNYPTLHEVHDQPAALWSMIAVFVFLKVCCGQFSFVAISAIVSSITVFCDKCWLIVDRYQIVHHLAKWAQLTDLVNHL